MRVLKSVVRPGRKNGGTTIVFRLTRRALVRFTIVRVYPTCERIGSFTVRAGPGLNGVRFNGRFRGRTLAAGTYRFLVHAQGQPTAVAAVTIVIARREKSPAALRRALKANSCSATEAREIESAAGAAASGGNESTGAAADAKQANQPSVILRLARAVKGVTHKASESLDVAPFSDRLKVIFGLFTLASAALGTFVLIRLARANGYHLRR